MDAQRAKKAPVRRAPSRREMPLTYLFSLLSEKIQLKNPRILRSGGQPAKILPSFQASLGCPGLPLDVNCEEFCYKLRARADSPGFGESHLYAGELNRTGA